MGTSFGILFTSEEELKRRFCNSFYD